MRVLVRLGKLVLGAIAGMAIALIGAALICLLLRWYPDFDSAIPFLLAVGAVCGIALAFVLDKSSRGKKALRAVFGVLAVVLGSSILMWVLYNTFVERQKEFRGSPVLGIAVTIAFLSVGWRWLRRTARRPHDDAKKPSVNIKNDPAPAYRRPSGVLDGWSIHRKKLGPEPAKKYSRHATAEQKLSQGQEMAVALNRLRFGKRFWLSALCGLIGLAIAGSFYGFRTLQRTAWRIKRGNNLHHIWMGLSNFEASHGTLPPAVRKDKTGRPLCSWRLQIFPYLESGPPIDFGEPWNSPANRLWANAVSPDFCWSAPAGSAEVFHTNVVAVTGPGTAFPDNRETQLKDLDAGMILLVEIAHSGIHWIAPGDLTLDHVQETLVRGVDGDGFHVLFADGQVWFLSAGTPIEQVKKFFTIEGAKKHDREQILGPYALRRAVYPSH